MFSYTRQPWAWLDQLSIRWLQGWSMTQKTIEGIYGLWCRLAFPTRTMAAEVQAVSNQKIQRSKRFDQRRCGSIKPTRIIYARAALLEMASESPDIPKTAYFSRIHHLAFFRCWMYYYLWMRGILRLGLLAPSIIVACEHRPKRSPKNEGPQQSD